MRKEEQDIIDYRYEKISQEDIINTIPKGEYIAVFGTSHTYGCCERDEYTHLDKKDMWVNLMRNDLGIEVFNVSLPGNINSNIVQQMTDFLSLPKDVLARCKAVVAEVRVGETAGSFSADLVSDFVIDERTINPYITQGADFYDLNERLKNWHSMLTIEFVNPLSINADPKEQATMLAINAQLNSNGEEFAPRQAVALVKDYVETHYKTEALTVRPVINDYQNIRVMKMLMELANIPFAWFCWDPCLYLDDEDFDKCNDIMGEVSTIFDAQIHELKETVAGMFLSIYGIEHYDAMKCECGHFGEEVNALVADFVTNHIKHMI